MNHQKHQYTTSYEYNYHHTSSRPSQYTATTTPITNRTVPRTRTTTYYYYPASSDQKSTQTFDRVSVPQTQRPTTPSTPELSHCSTPTTTPNNSPQQPSAKMRTVTFGMPEGARDAGFDERDVMKKFHSHISRCDTCYENLSSWRSGRPLCARGHGYVLDMRPYFFPKGGKPFSIIDREKKDERNRVFVPTEYRYVSTLFEALEGGYTTSTTRSTQKPKIVVHQSPSPVQVREVTPRREHRQTIVKPLVIPTERYVVTSSPRSPRTPRTQYHDERYHREPRRGSLYLEDQRRRYHHDAEIITVAPERYYR